MDHPFFDFTILIPITFFIMIGAIVIVPSWLKSRERREMQATLRTAIDKGQPLPAEIIDAMTKNVKVAPTSQSDLRAGVIWLAVGLGIAAFGYMVGFEDSDAFQPLVGIGSIPAIIGLAYIALSFVNPNKFKQP
ncbi:MAG: hypothetical protein HY859_01830 [Caulobacterales bacterium]|nr:hypothetical protein [Caulobacterales bacterium]